MQDIQIIFIIICFFVMLFQSFFQEELIIDISKNCLKVINKQNTTTIPINEIESFCIKIYGQYRKRFIFLPNIYSHPCLNYKLVIITKSKNVIYEWIIPPPYYMAENINSNYDFIFKLIDSNIPNFNYKILGDNFEYVQKDITNYINNRSRLQKSKRIYNWYSSIDSKSKVCCIVFCILLVISLILLMLSYLLN